MAWMNLFLAGLCEIAWALGLKYSKGFSEPIPTVITIVLIVVSFLLFSKAMATIPIGTAYAVFTGIGALGTAVIGIGFLNEEGGWAKICLLMFLLIGIIGLKMTTDEERPNEMTGGSS